MTLQEKIKATIELINSQNTLNDVKYVGHSPDDVDAYEDGGILSEWRYDFRDDGMGYGLSIRELEYQTQNIDSISFYDDELNGLVIPFEWLKPLVDIWGDE